MNEFDKILGKFGLSYEDLDKPGFAGEKETLESWARQLQSKEVTVSDIRDHVEAMRYSIQIALINEPEYERIFFGLIPITNRKHILLKARLHNYAILEAFMAGPGKTKKAIEQAINAIQSSKSKGVKS